MPHKISSYIKGLVILAKFEGEIVIDELAQVDKQVNAMISDGKPLVHFVVDGTEISKMRANLPKLVKIITYTRNPDLGWVVLVSQNPIMRFLAVTVTQISKVRFKSFSTLDDGLNFIYKMDPWLNRDEVAFEKE